MAKLLLTRRFQKSFQRLEKKTQIKVKEALIAIAQNPLVGKKLVGDLEGEYSYRIGRYRIIYLVENDAIWLETVRHRKEVYRKKR